MNDNELKSEQETIVPVTTEPEKNPLGNEAMMREQLSKLNKPVLVHLLNSKGFDSREDVPKAELVDAVIECHKRELIESDKTVAESTEAIADDDDPIVTMTFMNIESPDTPLEFTYDGPKGFRVGKDGGVLPARRWNFMHNRQYDVPLSVVNHLNSLKIPATNQVLTDTEGFIKNLYSGEAEKQPRFSCQLVISDEQCRQFAAAQKKKGK